MSPNGGASGSGPDPRGGLPARIVLVGFMAAGKTTVGRRLADRIGYRFVDLDAEVERQEGRSIPGIFREEGEEAFRRLEAEATRRLDDGAEAVVATGGGWMARPELRDRWDDAVRVWLKVSPEEVLRRVGGDVGSRPMLDPSTPGRSVRRILDARRGQYALAEVHVDTDGRTPEGVAEQILEELRRS